MYYDLSMHTDMDEKIRVKFKWLTSVFDEQSRRLWAAAEAKAIGFGGVSCVSGATGLSRTTIHQGLKDIDALSKGSQGSKRMRCPGGGRKRIAVQNPTLTADLERIVDPETRGDPESPLRWTCKSVRNIAKALQIKGYEIGRQKVADLLGDLNYSLQGNRKTKEGAKHPGRDAQFRYINEKVVSFQKRNQPVVSVDTKKKEAVGDFKNRGSEC